MSRGVYIKGIEMPQNCGDCPCAHIFDSFTCRAAKRSFDKYPFENREDWCPLIEVPEPHGRLIDADALEDMVIKEKHFCAKTAAKHEIIVELYKSFGLHDAELMIEAAPTIIPASTE